MTLGLDHPWALLLLPLPLLARWLLPVWQGQRAALRLPFLASLPAGPAVQVRRAWHLAAGLLVWLLLVLALAAPVRIEPPVTREIGGRDVMLALDLSGSMETEDMVGATRIEAARAVLKSFIADRPRDRIGLIVFGTAAFVLAPFTADHRALLGLLDESFARMAGPQTMIGDAIGLAAQGFERAEARGRLLVLLTDGNDTGSRVPPARAAGIAGRLGVRIYTVSLGDPAAVGEAALDVATLEAIAAGTGGAHFHAGDPAALAEIYRRIDALEPTSARSVSWRPRRPLFVWPLAGVAALVALLSLAGGRQGAAA